MSNDFGTFIAYQIGEVFYAIDFDKTICEFKISGLHIKADNSLKIRLTNCKRRSVFEVTEEELLKRFFEKMEDAKKALEVINIE